MKSHTLIIKIPRRVKTLLDPKLEYACRQALEDNLQYVWTDTCSIEKSSSAELSEAINSMYRW